MTTKPRTKKPAAKPKRYVRVAVKAGKATLQESDQPNRGFKPQRQPKPTAEDIGRNIGDMHGQRQIGQHATVAMCPWHHDGDQLPGKTRGQMRDIYGPSFKHHARDFRAWTADVLPYDGKGTEAWQQYQDSLLSHIRHLDSRISEIPIQIYKPNEGDI